MVRGDEPLPARPAGAPDPSGDFYDVNGNRVSTWPLPPSATKVDEPATTTGEAPATSKVEVPATAKVEVPATTKVEVPATTKVEVPATAKVAPTMTARSNAESATPSVPN